MGQQTAWGICLKCESAKEDFEQGHGRSLFGEEDVGCSVKSCRDFIAVPAADQEASPLAQVKEIMAGYWVVREPSSVGAG